MIAIVLAVLPVFLLIFVGSFVHWRGLVAHSFWAPAETLTYYVFFPALLITTLARADLDALAAFETAAALVTAILAMSLVVLSLGRWLKVDGPALTSVFQGAVRMNTYIGLAIAFAMHGSEGLDAAALSVAAIVPVVNVLSVLVLLRYGTSERPSSPLTVLFQVVRNPLIIACAVGLVMNLLGLGLPPVLGPMLEILGHTALPLGLLAVGAGLNFGAVRGHVRATALASALKLLALPALTFAACLLYGVDSLGTFVAVTFNALPTASTAYILARQLGGDAGLMATLTTVQTAAAMITVPVMLMVLA